MIVDRDLPSMCTLHTMLSWSALRKCTQKCPSVLTSALVYSQVPKCTHNCASVASTRTRTHTHCIILSFFYNSRTESSHEVQSQTIVQSIYERTFTVHVCIPVCQILLQHIEIPITWHYAGVIIAACVKWTYAKHESYVHVQCGQCNMLQHCMSMSMTSCFLIIVCNVCKWRNFCKLLLLSVLYLPYEMRGC